MAGEVVVNGVIVEVEVGGGEFSPGRGRPARDPAEANLGMDRDLDGCRNTQCWIFLESSHHKSSKSNAECKTEGEDKYKSNLGSSRFHPRPDLERDIFCALHLERDIS